MATAHLLIGQAVAILVLAMLAVSVAMLALPAHMRVWLDRAILATLGALALGILSGLPLALLAGLPSDPLHVVYGLAAPLTLLGGRYLGRRGSLRRRAAIMVVTGLALAGIVYRLFTTAGGAG